MMPAPIPDTKPAMNVVRLGHLLIVPFVMALSSSIVFIVDTSSIEI
jgi:hypothetical protein